MNCFCISMATVLFLGKKRTHSTFGRKHIFLLWIENYFVAKGKEFHHKKYSFKLQKKTNLIYGKNRNFFPILTRIGRFQWFSSRFSRGERGERVIISSNIHQYLTWKRQANERKVNFQSKRKWEEGGRGEERERWEGGVICSPSPPIKIKGEGVGGGGGWEHFYYHLNFFFQLKSSWLVGL